MIVRILGQGQYRLRGADLDRLNEIDNRIVEAVGRQDEAAFRRCLAEMLDYVRQTGKALPVEELIESDVILPGDDITLAEARAIFSGEGAIPG